MRLEWRPYVSVAERRHKAAQEMARLRKKGHRVSPVVINGRSIAHTFWGKAWCENLERYSDYANRLPRGRTYVRNGSVVDLQIAPGVATAKVSGSDIYRIGVTVVPLPKARWKAICKDCVGGIDSLVELLQGRFAKGVMERISQPRTGLFPAPAEIKLGCSCPDWASMCKHVAAVLYGIGARLDEQPELLFTLREVNEEDLIAHAGTDLPLTKKGPAAERLLVADGLADIFGLDMAEGVSQYVDSTVPARPGKRTRPLAAASKKAGAGPGAGGKKQPAARRKATKPAPKKRKSSDVR